MMTQLSRTALRSARIQQLGSRCHDDSQRADRISEVTRSVELPAGLTHTHLIH